MDCQAYGQGHTAKFTCTGWLAVLFSIIQIIIICVDAHSASMNNNIMRPYAQID